MQSQIRRNMNEDWKFAAIEERSGRSFQSLLYEVRVFEQIMKGQIENFAFLQYYVSSDNLHSMSRPKH